MYLKSFLFLVIGCWFCELDAYELKHSQEAEVSSKVDTQAFKFYTMLGKGNNWHIAHYANRRLAVHILSALNAREDRSLYGFQAKDIDGMPLSSTQRYTVFMNGNGNGWYECASGFVVTGMYFYDQGDRSVERFECTKVLGKSTYPLFDFQNADINGPVVCGKVHGKDTYTTGFYYQDTGDDRIRFMLCGYFFDEN